MFLLWAACRSSSARFGIANITLVGVMERTARLDCGRAIGATRRHIASQFSSRARPWASWGTARIECRRADRGGVSRRIRSGPRCSTRSLPCLRQLLAARSVCCLESTPPRALPRSNRPKRSDISWTSNSIWLAREVESGDALLTRAILSLLSGFAPGRALAPYLVVGQLVSAWRAGSILVLPALRRVSMQLLIQRTWLLDLRRTGCSADGPARPVTMNVGKPLTMSPR